MSKPRIAIIGSGVSGLTAAYVLRDSHDITLFEADNRFGGHAHTHRIETSTDPLYVDSGFIVHNERTYPNLLRIFKELGVKTNITEMSMSIHCEGCGLTYAGGRGLKGILAQRKAWLRPEFWKMLIDVPRFHRTARELVESEGDSEITWGDFLKSGGYSDFFIRHFAIPLVSCVWSSGDEDSLAYPAKHLFQFLNHHGMLTLGNSPTWRTVVGGSRVYVEKILATIPNARSSAEVVKVERLVDGVEITTANGETEKFEQAIIATHANSAAKILHNPTAEEIAALNAIPYSQNQTWMHTDENFLPKEREAKASWNYRTAGCDADEQNVLVSYWMNRLMLLPGETNYIVTLNAAGRIDESKVIAKMQYEHPVFTIDAVAAAKVLKDAGGDRLAFAGAHLGWGFHEDGARSGVEAARKFGGTW